MTGVRSSRSSDGYSRVEERLATSKVGNAGRLFASPAIARAAISRICSDGRFAARRISPEQSLTEIYSRNGLYLIVAGSLPSRFDIVKHVACDFHMERLALVFVARVYTLPPFRCVDI